MYSLDVNFLKDRPDYKGGEKEFVALDKKQPLKLEKPMLIGGVFGLAFPILVLAIWGFLNWQNSQAEQAVANLDAEIAELSIQQQRVQELQGMVDEANAEVAALTSIFNQIKPWSAILQDVRDRVPSGVQIESISQGEEDQLTITGFAASYDGVTDFLLSLQQSQFLENGETSIQSAQLISNPTPVEDSEEVTVELPDVVNYTLTTNINRIPASEILQELDRKGAVGLVTRIRTLQEQGIIEQ